MKLLDFSLPPFARHTWASEAAKGVWQPRVRELQRRGADIACRLVLSGARPCAPRVIPAWQLFELYGKLPALGLTVETLEPRGALHSSYFNAPPDAPNRPAHYCVVVGQAARVAHFKSAWEAEDEAELDRLTGYPACCRVFFKRTFIEQGLADGVWSMASNSDEAEAGALTLEVGGPPHTNVLWASLGLRAVNHWPCRFDCEATAELAEEFFEAGRDGGFAAEVGWLSEILSWPTEWSALHGIAEIKTPVLKMLTNTDATAEKYVVRRVGSSYPAEGARGLAFPYASPARLQVTASEGFRRGLENPIALVNITPKSSPDAHAPAQRESCAPPARGPIDWGRMAEPQEDRYDTRVTLELATTCGSPLRREPYVRRAVADAPTIFDGAVAVRYISETCPGLPRHAHGPVDHPNIARAAEYVRRWPAAFAQFRALMDSFHPMTDAGVPPALDGSVLGSSSHSEESMFGTMWATFYDPLGLAQAFVHEMAHQKLRALGVSLEAADRLITNRPGELYASPIRKDRPRPMTAVFHAQYSFIYVTALDLRMIETETDPRTLSSLLTLLGRNVPRIEEGLRVIREHVQVDEDGRVFVDAFIDWAARVIREGNAVLRHAGKA